MLPWLPSSQTPRDGLAWGHVEQEVTGSGLWSVTRQLQPALGTGGESCEASRRGRAIAEAMGWGWERRAVPSAGKGQEVWKYRRKGRTWDWGEHEQNLWSFPKTGNAGEHRSGRGVEKLFRTRSAQGAV